jgi:predicted RNA-binding protein (virulence factor B family)
MVVDPAHEVISIPAERWQRWHEIAREIGNNDCGLAKELCIANTAPTRRNLYWAATAARILVQWTTGDRQRLASTIATELESAAVPPHRALVGAFTENGDIPIAVPTVVDLAHEAVSIPVERWQRWHEIVREIGNNDCGLAKDLCIANTAPTRRNLYWAATAARILVQWTTGDRQRLANAIAAELEHAGTPPH